MILITGANGFVGTSLCSALAKAGLQVRCAVRKMPELTNKNCNENAEVGSISSDTDWRNTLKGISTVVHLAARVHVMKETSTDLLSEFRKINVDATEHLAEMAAEAGVKRFVFLSTIKVHGEQTTDKPFDEIEIPCPEDPYAISKWEAEQALHNISKKTGLEIVILRPPLVYGPGVKANFLRLLQIVELNIPLPFLNINNKRSLIFIKNLIDAIITCCISPNAKGETFLVSDGEDVSTSELIKMIASAMNKKARLFPLPQSLLNIMGALTGKKKELDRLCRSFYIDSTKIRRILNWRPPFNMREGINETVNWYKSQ